MVRHLSSDSAKFNHHTADIYDSDSAKMSFRSKTQTFLAERQRDLSRQSVVVVVCNYIFERVLRGSFILDMHLEPCNPRRIQERPQASRTF